MRFDGQWCEHQAQDDDGIYCAAHIHEGRTLDCPFRNLNHRIHSQYPCSDYKPVTLRDSQDILRVLKGMLHKSIMKRDNSDGYGTVLMSGECDALKYAIQAIQERDILVNQSQEPDSPQDNYIRW